MKFNNYLFWGILITFVVSCNNIQTYHRGNELFIISKNNSEGFIDINGNIIIQPKYNIRFPFYDDLAHIKVNNKYGFIDTRGMIVIPPKFISTGVFHEGLCNVEYFDSFKKVGYINKKGSIVISFDKSLVLGDFQDGLASIFDPSVREGYYIDTKGTIVIRDNYYSTQDFSEGLAAVAKMDMLFGYIDKNGKYVINPQFVKAYKFNEGLAVVAFGNLELDEYGHNNEYAVIDKTGKFIFNRNKYKYIHSKFSEGLIVVKHKGILSYSDRYGNIIISNSKFKSLGDFSEGLAAAEIAGGKIGYINRKGIFVINPIFDRAGEFKNGLSYVRKIADNKWYYINREGKIVYSIDN